MKLISFLSLLFLLTLLPPAIAQPINIPSDFPQAFQATLFKLIVFDGDASIPYNVSIKIDCNSEGVISQQPIILRSSSNKAWDEAVLNAITKMGTMPRDSAGNFFCPLVASIQQRPSVNHR